MTEDELLKQSVPFDVIEKNHKRKYTIEGISRNAPRGLFPGKPIVYFAEGGWSLVEDLIQFYDLVEEPE